MVEPATPPAMADAPYLVALALCSFAGQRALPLTGRSLAAGSDAAGSGVAGSVGAGPGPAGEQLALELLLRLFQRSEAGALQRLAADTSLLLVELPLELMSEQLPRLKGDWLAGGTTEAFLDALAALGGRGWTLAIAKYEPVRFSPWPSAALA